MAEVGAAEIAQFQQGLSDSQKMIFTTQYNSDRKDRTLALVLGLLLGFLGVDRFYVGHVGMGLLKMFTLGLCGILTIYDWFVIRGIVDDFNRAKAQEIAASLRTA
jgi:TM2 domain-containing membrane protein YozV